MIGITVAAGALDLAAGTISMDISSPYFEADTVPGTITYPFGLPMSPTNQQALGFPHVRADVGEKLAPEPASFYIDGVLRWVGSLVYLDCDEDAQLYEYNFVADAADLASRIDGVSLVSLPLGTEPLVLETDNPLYALPCLRNKTFYDADKVKDYCQIINYYSGSYKVNPGGKRSPMVPFLRLVPLIRRVFGAVGYAVSGPWLDLPEVQRLVIYSDRAAEDAEGKLLAEFALNRHVPDMNVGDLLIQLQKFFGLAYDFHPVRRELRIKALRDVIADPTYVDRTGGPARTTAVTTDGFTLEMGLESDDDLNKTLDTGWKKMVIGRGKEVISTDAGTLHVVREKDPLDASREWLLPAVEVKGASLAFETGDDSRCGLRLLYDRGLQDDALGYLGKYPLATWDMVNCQGATVGQSTLHWDGDNGLYATWHAGWLAFLDRATSKERSMQFRVADLLSLDPARKEMVDNKKYLWEKVSLSLSTTGSALETATFTYRYTRL
jgi:hypothetical protein